MLNRSAASSARSRMGKGRTKFVHVNELCALFGTSVRTRGGSQST